MTKQHIGTAVEKGVTAMTEYIDREALLRDIEHYNVSDGKFQHWVEIQRAADVAPAVHGRWVHHIAGEKQISDCWCSVCNVEQETEQNYCPNCGARMDGGED